MFVMVFIKTGQNGSKLKNFWEKSRKNRKKIGKKVENFSEKNRKNRKKIGKKVENNPEKA
jgi:hypothetical protein